MRKGMVELQALFREATKHMGDACIKARRRHRNARMSGMGADRVRARRRNLAGVHRRDRRVGMDWCETRT